MTILSHKNGTKIYITWSLSIDPKLTYFKAYLHGTITIKTKPRMTILGHGNGTKIHIKWSMSIDPKLTYFEAYFARNIDDENDT